MFSYWSKQQWQTFTPRVSSVVPDCITLWVLADSPLLVLNLDITQPSTPDSFCTFSPSNNNKMQFLQLTIPHMNGGVENNSKEEANVDCVVWLKTACWSSLPWCFEDRWRLGWLKTAAGNYLVSLSFLIFSAMIYKLAAVYNSLAIGHVSFWMDRKLSCSRYLFSHLKNDNWKKCYA